MAVTTAATLDDVGEWLEPHRRALTGYCYRMLGSVFEADDAVQETFVRAWRSIDRFDGRAPLEAWLYRIATNVCLNLLRGRQRRALPVDVGPASAGSASLGAARPREAWVEPIPDARVLSPGADPAEVAVAQDSVRLAFVVALQYLPARQRAVLILRDVLRWPASEVATMLDASVPSVKSLLQRARATLATAAGGPDAPVEPDDEAQRELLDRYVDAFRRYDIDALVALLHEDATMSMPPFELWLRGPADIGQWLSTEGADCSGSVLVPAGGANGSHAFGLYRDGEPFAVNVLELGDGSLRRIDVFLDSRLFPLFGLPPNVKT